MRSAHYLALLGGIASVSADVVGSEVHCATSIGTKSVFPVGTTTVASTSTVALSDATTTTAVTDTITEPAVTSTTTETEQVTVTTTEPTVTDTYTSTLTETATATVTTTESETQTATETTTETTTPTTTVAAPSGFRPISDTVNGFPAQKLKRNARHPHCRPKSTSSSPAYPHTTALQTSDKDCGVAPVPTQYPQIVECTATVTEQSTATETTTASTTVTPAPITSTETTTITSTSTENPHASTTVTTTETATTTATETTTETSTVTTTTTATATAPDVVVYDACSASNLLGPQYNGNPIVNVYNNNNGNVGGGSIYDNGSAASAYDCCVQCINKAGCTGTAYQSGRCVLLRNSGNTCDSQSSNAAAFVTGSGGSGFTLSNGLCGYQKFGGGQ